MVTTTDTTRPAGERIGVTFKSVRTLRPSATESSTSSARRVSALPSCRERGSASSETSRPSSCRHVITSSSCSGGRPGVRRCSTMRRASRLNETGWPVAASNTATPTGEVSMSAARSVRARSTSRCVRALAIRHSPSRGGSHPPPVAPRDTRSTASPGTLAGVLRRRIGGGVPDRRDTWDNIGQERHLGDLLARISHTSRLAVVRRATRRAVASGGAIMRRNIGPS